MELTICGHFVECTMATNELRYNLRRMWSKFGLLDVQVNANGRCLFKFKNDEGMESVLDQGPWVVNNKPLFVQKWDPVLGMEKVEATKIPLLAELNNVPLEAWTEDGISALASSLGTPIRMDNVTAQVCQSGMGRAEYTRVLVEFDVNKGIKEEIGIQYRDNENVVKGTKTIKVKYQWKPEICSQCKVFAHDITKCK